MQITRNDTETAPAGPAEYFTGTVYIDTIATPSGPSRLGAASVALAPGARTARHTHPLGRTVYVTEGVGLCQRRGVPVEVMRPGDRVFFEPDEDHWHGAAPDRFRPLQTLIALRNPGNTDRGENRCLALGGIAKRGTWRKISTQNWNYGLTRVLLANRRIFTGSGASYTRAMHKKPGSGLARV